MGTLLSYNIASKITRGSPRVKLGATNFILLLPFKSWKSINAMFLTLNFKLCK